MTRVSEAGVPPTRATTDSPISYGARSAELAEHRLDDVAIVFARADGTEQAFTWSELDGAATRVGRALAGRGAGVGDRPAGVIDEQRADAAIERFPDLREPPGRFGISQKRTIEIGGKKADCRTRHEVQPSFESKHAEMRG